MIRNERFVTIIYFTVLPDIQLKPMYINYNIFMCLDHCKNSCGALVHRVEIGQFVRTVFQFKNVKGQRGNTSVGERKN